jgi:hypothetical protein
MNDSAKSSGARTWWSARRIQQFWVLLLRVCRCKISCGSGEWYPSAKKFHPEKKAESFLKEKEPVLAAAMRSMGI